ncbi:MAG: Bro-N domain-containing protein, partial [Patescibacteria group bacterium]
MGKKHIIQSDNIIVNFENIPVRRVWNAEKEQWFFAIVDVVAVLSESPNPSGYIKDMRRRDKGLSTGWGQIATPLYIKTKGGEQKINCANVEGILRIVQSIPSKNAEPFKSWLAKVGYERLQETINPELAVDRARSNWKQAGRSEKWVEQRMRGQETRNKLTDYWKDSGVKEGLEYANLTDIIHKEWSGLTTKQHKKVKGLRGHNLRDNMTEGELIFTALAELSTTQIAKSEEAKGYNENEKSAHKGGQIAGNARKALE